MSRTQSRATSEWDVIPSPDVTAPETLTVTATPGNVTFSEGDELVRRESVDSGLLTPSQRLIELRRYEIVGVSRESDIIVYTQSGKRHVAEPRWVVRLRCENSARTFCPKLLAAELSDPRGDWFRDPPADMPSTLASWRAWASELPDKYQ